MSELKDRFNEIITSKDLTVSKLEKTLNLPNAFIRKYLKGEKNDISHNVLCNLLNKFPDINPLWLLLGEGEMLKNETGDCREEMEILKKENDSLKELVAAKNQIIELLMAK